jgi:hypothetical protein
MSDGEGAKPGKWMDPRSRVCSRSVLGDWAPCCALVSTFAYVSPFFLNVLFPVLLGKTSSSSKPEWTKDCSTTCLVQVRAVPMCIHSPPLAALPGPQSLTSVDSVYEVSCPWLLTGFG